MKRTFLAGVLGMLLSAGLATAQGYDRPDPGLPAEKNIYFEPAVPRQLSDWITWESRDYYPAPGMNMHPAPPVVTDVFLRAGPSTPFGAGTLAQVLDTGWTIDGGVRALFFNAAMDRAWVLECGVSNTYNAANSSSPNFPKTINVNEGGLPTSQVVTVRDLNQTFVNVGVGREWYLWHFGENRSLQIGVDVGTRLGSAKMDFNEIGYRSGMIYGGYAALHADLLFPLGGIFTLVCGVRGEWDVMQNENILQTTTTLQEASLLFNVGLRF